MKLKLAVTEDSIAIASYCSNNKMGIPKSKTILLALDEHNAIIGLIGLDSVCLIEPIIADTSKIANDLYMAVYGILVNSGTRVVEILVKGDESVMNKTAEHLGFFKHSQVNRYIKII